MKPQQLSSFPLPTKTLARDSFPPCSLDFLGSASCLGPYPIWSLRPLLPFSFTSDVRLLAPLHYSDLSHMEVTKSYFHFPIFHRLHGSGDMFKYYVFQGYIWHRTGIFDCAKQDVIVNILIFFRWFHFYPPFVAKFSSDNNFLRVLT